MRHYDRQECSVQVFLVKSAQKEYGIRTQELRIGVVVAKRFASLFHDFITRQKLTNAQHIKDKLEEKCVKIFPVLPVQFSIVHVLTDIPDRALAIICKRGLVM